MEQLPDVPYDEALVDAVLAMDRRQSSAIYSPVSSTQLLFPSLDADELPTTKTVRGTSWLEESMQPLHPSLMTVGAPSNSA